jgi:hypothetical protein
MPKEDAMTPRSPEDSPEEKVQDQALQPVREVLNKDASADLAQRSTPALNARQEEELDMKVEVELDRVALYLRGPTVFTA